MQSVNYNAEEKEHTKSAEQQHVIATVVADATVSVVVGDVERGADLGFSRRLTAVDLRHHGDVLARCHEPVAVHVELVEDGAPDFLARHPSHYQQQVTQTDLTAVTCTGAERSRSWP